MVKLGTDTGSLVNYVTMNASNTIVPEVGMGVTFYHWSDRSAGTIQEVVEIRGRTYIRITHDEARRTDNNGFSESQEYEFIQKPDGHRSWYRQTKDGRGWERVMKNSASGRWNKCIGASIRIGHRQAYRDFSF